MVRVILDTNFLLLPYQEHIDVFTDIQRVIDGKADFCIIDKTEKELEKLMRLGTMKDRSAAKLGRMFVREFRGQGKLKVIHTIFAHDVDDALMKKAGRHDYVATQDKELKESLKNKGIKVITLRGNHCVIEHK